MTRATITPQFLADLLDTHAIGADAPGGVSLGAAPTQFDFSETNLYD